MHHRVPWQAVQAHRLPHRLPESVVIPYATRFHIAVLATDELFQRPVRNTLAPCVGLMRRHSHGLGHLRHRRPTLERGKSPDHGHPVQTIALVQPSHDLLAPVPRQVKVDIGQLAVTHALPVEEALKPQPEPERAHIGHTQRVTDQAAGGTAARKQRDPATTAFIDNLAEHKEIASVSSF